MISDNEVRQCPYIYMYNDMAVVGCCYVSAGARQREVGDTQCAVCAHVLIMCKDFKL